MGRLYALRIEKYREKCNIEAQNMSFVIVERISMPLSTRLKRERERKGWSQNELSRKSGVRQALISELESGKKRDTTGSVLKRLARTLGVTMDYLGGMYEADEKDEPAQVVAGYSKTTSHWSNARY